MKRKNTALYNIDGSLLSRWYTTVKNTQRHYLKSEINEPGLKPKGVKT